MRRALDEYYITGIKTTVPFHSAIMRNADFRNGTYDTGFVERVMNSENFELQAAPAGCTISVRAVTPDRRRLYGILDLGYVDAGAMRNAVARAMIAGGVDMIQLRAKGATLAEITDARGKLHRVTSARRRSADHQRSPRDRARGWQRKAFMSGRTICPIAAGRARSLVAIAWSGKSTHSLEQAQRPRSEGADYIGFGPLFATPTKPDYPPIGLKIFTRS